MTSLWLLIQMLLDKNVDPTIKPQIVKALKDLSDASLIGSMLASLQDDTIEWEIRWLLTESLENLQESASDSLMKMLESPDIDGRVRVGIAATLGTWGVREVIPYLREAIQMQVVPANLRFEKVSEGRTTRTGYYIWDRITRILKNLGDDSVVPALNEAWSSQ